jgi:hypothetical protein
MRIATAFARAKQEQLTHTPRPYRPSHAPAWGLPIREESRQRWVCWWEREWWRLRIARLEGDINDAFCRVGLWDVPDADFYVNGRWRWDFWNTIAEHCAEFYRQELVKERAAHDRTFSQLEASRAYNGKLNLALIEVQEGVRQLRHELELARAVDVLTRNGDGA